MKVALFKYVKYGFESVWTEGMEPDPDYVRISEYVDVEFPPLENSEIVNNEIASLKESKKQIQAETEAKIGVIDRRIGDLLSLTHEG